MSEEYQYLDLKSDYVDPLTGILYNIPNLSDPRDLLFFESTAVTQRLSELIENPIPVSSSTSLLQIHQHLFQDVYAWAGKVRTVNISKAGKPFFEWERFQQGFTYIDSLLNEYELISPREAHTIAQKLALILDNLNFLHPFREGNGRAQREFIRALAVQKGYLLNLNPPDNKSIYERYMKGTVEGDLALLEALIFNELRPLP
jgi:cell filamentation protein